MSEIITNSNREVINILEVREAKKSEESELKEQLIQASLFKMCMLEKVCL